MSSVPPVPRENLDAVCRTAFTHYGVQSQLDKLQEECAEVVVAVNHFRLLREDAESRLVEEMADATIMIRQITLALKANDELDAVMQVKLRALIGRIRDERIEAGQKKPEALGRDKI